jgi:chorismate synthase
VRVRGYLSQLGPLRPQGFDWEQVELNPFFCPDAAAVPELEAYMDALRKSGDSIGAEVTVVAEGVPPGLGEPIFDRLDADIAHALMCINAVKGVEIGAGFGCVTQKGSEHRDLMTPGGFLSNHAGGVLGGISSGQDIVARLALKPTSSIRLPGQTVDRWGQPAEIVTKGPPRPLRGHPGHAHRRGHAGPGADGPLVTPSGPERGRDALGAPYPRQDRRLKDWVRAVPRAVPPQLA